MRHIRHLGQDEKPSRSSSRKLFTSLSAISNHIDELEAPTLLPLASGAIPAIEIDGDFAAFRGVLECVRAQIAALRSASDRLPGVPRGSRSSLARAAL